MSKSLAFMINGGSKFVAPSSNDARYKGLSQTGGESLASINVILRDTTDACPLPSSSVAYMYTIIQKFYIYWICIDIYINYREIAIDNKY